MRVTNLLIVCLITGILCLVPFPALAGNVMIFKGSTVIDNDMDGLITLPDGRVVTSSALQVASWGLHFGSEDIVVYDPASMMFSHYTHSTIVTLPELDEIVETSSGIRGTLSEILDVESFVVFNTDIGSFEVDDTGFTMSVPGTTIVIDQTTISVVEGSTATFRVKLSSEPSGDVNVQVAWVSGDPDITVLSGFSLTFTQTNWSTYKAVTIAAAEDLDSTNGSAEIRVSAGGLSAKTITATEIDNDSDGDGDGMPDNWEDQYPLLDKTTNDAGGDLDSDGLINLDEYLNSTDPTNYDTDNDGIPDGWEVENNLDPKDPEDAFEDADLDGISNYQEYVDGTDPQDDSSYIPWTGTIMGTVVSTVIGYEAGIFNALVTLEGTDYATTTDLGGSFTIADVPYGEYTLRIEAPYFITHVENVLINDGFIFLGPIELRILCDANNDGVIGLEEVINILQILSGS